MGIPIFLLKWIKSDNVNGFKAVVLSVLNLTMTFGTTAGDHLHFAFGLLRWEVFFGFSIWEKNAK
jgi:hypothetical protein